MLRRASDPRDRELRTKGISFRKLLGRASKEGFDLNTNKYFKGDKAAEEKGLKGIPDLHPGESLQK